MNKQSAKKTVGTIFFVLLSFILPLAALLFGIGLTDGTFNPMPTPFHLAMVVSVTAIGLALCILWLRKANANRWWVMALCGLSCGICAVYTLMMIPLMLFGVAVFVAAFWWWGIGLIGLLPWAPCGALVCTLVFWVKTRRRAAQEGIRPASGFLVGILAAAALWACTVAGQLATVYGVNRAFSPDPAVAADGVRFLRAYAQYDTLLDFCARRYYSRTPLDTFGEFRMLLNDNAEEQLRSGRGNELFYRVTGEDLSHYYNSWERRGRGRMPKLRWDAITGGDKVGGILEGLSLKGSAYDTTVDSAAGVAYSEWTITFANTFHFEREARMRLALPPGGTVSRLTLWIDGEECEAAFGGKGQVRRAYESVVRRRRDPVLVSSCGPGEVQVQCFPVPANGEMKLRLGISFPLRIAADGKSHTIPAPAIIARNFAIPSGLPGLPRTESGVFENEIPRVSVFRTDDTNLLDNAAILQRVSREEAVPPEAIVVVVDTSLAMKDALGNLGAALADAPANTPVEVWLADDALPSEPAYTSAAQIGSIDCIGGKDNLPLLDKVVDSVAARGIRAPVIWLHGPQPYTSSTADALAQKLNKNKAKILFCPVQCVEGENRIVEELPCNDAVRNYSAVAMEKGVKSALACIFAEWDGTVRAQSREKVAPDKVPEDAVRASDHVGRIWAAETAARTYRVGDPKTLEAAKKIALPWHVVTPVTGAVVLETKEQYVANGLEQVSADSVPTVPEPESVFCLAVAAVVMFVVLFLSRRRRATAKTR